jgi:hypothetical protein
MNLNLYPFVVVFALMAAAVIALIITRKLVASAEDDTLHVMEGDAAMIPRQQAIAHKLEVIDRWGKSLTVLTIVFGLVIGALWVYQSWVTASNYMAH